MQEYQGQKEEKIAKSRAPENHVVRKLAQYPEQQGMQRKKGELLAVRVVDVKRGMPVTAVREPAVMSHIGVRHYLAKPARNLRTVKRDERIVRLYLRVGGDDELSGTDHDEEDQSSREHEDEECLTYASIVAKAN